LTSIFSIRLINPKSCKPSWGPRYNAECTQCTDEKLSGSGLTFFKKIRLDIKSLRIISRFKILLSIVIILDICTNKGNDFSFATARYGSLVPYATAGDCYSLESHCIQVTKVLSINLKNN
jgi:hypothetical protein